MRPRIPRWAKRAGPCLLWCYLALSAGALPTDPETVDITPAYRFGAHVLSQYQVDKHFNQFKAQNQAPPTPAQTREWFRRFIAEHALIARLRERGYANRKEVTAACETMERYIIDQESGPFLSTIIPTSLPTDSEVAAAALQSMVKLEGIFLRMDSLPEGFIANLQNQTESDQFARLKEMLGKGQAEGYEGPLLWPFHPFMDLRSVWVSSPLNRLQVFPDAALGPSLCLIKKRTIAPSTIPPEHLADYLALIDRGVRLQTRREALRRAASLRFEEPALARLAQVFQQWSVPPRWIDTGSLPIPPETALCTFQLEGAPQRLRLIDFITLYNFAVERSLPQSPQTLRSWIEAWVLREANWREAERAGFTSTPRFRENRRHFEDYRILELYKDESIRKHVRIQTDECLSYFHAHRPEYDRVEAVRGTLKIYLQPTDIGQTPPDEVIENFTISDPPDPRIAGWPLPILLSMPNGEGFGPLTFENRSAVFEKEAVVRHSIPPFEVLETTIRQLLTERVVEERWEALLSAPEETPPDTQSVDYLTYGISDPLAREEASKPSP